METISTLARRMAAGELTSAELTKACLDRLLDPQGEGARAFTMIDPERSVAVAGLIDKARAEGRPLSPLAGLPVSIKALFDIEGKVTHSGSKVLRNAPIAKADAVAVARLRAAGMVVMGHTNMTEFAYSGLGLNPHYGTPGNPADRTRIPGGSSSGAAVSVADGMAVAGLGTDTGGSCRIPAAFCGLVGFKPTARRIPDEGAFPLSKTLDCIGPIARSVECCALIDAALADEPIVAPAAVVLSGQRLGVLQNYVLDGMEPTVAASYEAALTELANAGVILSDIRLPDLDRLPELNARGGIIAAEAFALHQDFLARHGDAYDPRVSVRIRRALTLHAGEYEALLAERQRIIARVNAQTHEVNAILMPTVPIVAPGIVDLERDDALFGSTNLLALRNPTVANFLDRPAISVPLPVRGLPVGLTLMGETMADRDLLALARAVEGQFAA